jgi:thymidylate synthase
MSEERDLGPIYGFQWRHFGAEYNNHDTNYSNQGYDQLSSLVQKLNSNPNDRRMLVNAWNPNDLDKMALPPCHYSFEVNVSDEKLNLKWNQRSVDTMLGLPFNIASYGTLLTLLANEANLEQGILTGHLGDTHIYENHIDYAKTQLMRKPLSLPDLRIKNFTSIFDWTSEDIDLENYQSYQKIKFPIAI